LATSALNRAAIVSFSASRLASYGRVPCLAPSRGPHIARAHVRRGAGDAP
jgi:hypothetical protein